MSTVLLMLRILFFVNRNFSTECNINRKGMSHCEEQVMKYLSELITVDPAVGQEYRLDNLLISPSAVFSIALLPGISDISSKW